MKIDGLPARIGDSSSASTGDLLGETYRSVGWGWVSRCGLRYASIALKEASSAAIASSMLIDGFDDDGVGEVGETGFVVGLESWKSAGSWGV